VLALALAGVGGFAADSAGVTGGWLLGALVVVFAAGAFGMPLALPGWLRSIAMGFAGITVGAAITAETAELVSLLPLTLALMFVFLAVLIVSTYLLHRYCWGASRATALACAWPGNVLLVFISAESTRANMPQVAVVQSVRVLALMGILPLTIGLYHTPVFSAAIPLSVDLGLAAIVALVCVVVAVRLSLVGGEMFLTAFAVGVLSGFDILRIAIPREMVSLFQIVVGAYIGIELAKCGARAFMSALVPSLASAIYTAVATIAMAFALASLVDYSVAALALALAPGGAEAMILLTVAFGVDPAFVGIHHTVRLVALTFGFPLILRWASKMDHQATGSR
jgi:membrane AbrB-like protein